MALVISNEHYTDPAFNLPGATRDAELIAKTLRDPSLGFTVTRAKDLSTAELRKAIKDFEGTLKKAGPAVIGFIYYAGHGGADADENYLLGSNVGDIASADAASKGLSQSEIIGKLANVDQPAVIVVVLDACRTLSKPVPGTPSNTRAVGAMAKLEEPTRGFLIALSTGNGSSASDSGRYADALAKNLLAPGLSIEQVFERTSKEINEATAGHQIPASVKNLASEVCLLNCASDLKAGAYVQNKELFESARHTAINALDTLANMHVDTRCPTTWKALNDLKMQADTLTARKQVDAAGATYAKIKYQEMEVYPYVLHLERLEETERLLAHQQSRTPQSPEEPVLRSYNVLQRRYARDLTRLDKLDATSTVKIDRAKAIGYYQEAEKLSSEGRLEDADDRLTDAINAVEALLGVHHRLLTYKKRLTKHTVMSAQLAAARIPAISGLCQ